VLVNDTDASKNQKIVIPGGAGLVGQNLVTRLLGAGYSNLVVLDKHAHNLGVLQALHPDVTTVSADLSEPGDWAGHFDKSQAVVMLQAQIGASHSAPFEANNVRATERVLAETKNYGIPYLVHVSSSVVRSVADDDYTRTKRLQEQMVVVGSTVNTSVGWRDLCAAFPCFPSRVLVGLHVNRFMSATFVL
jgi:nucleoside-diphosphate-sugar epimerase